MCDLKARGPCARRSPEEISSWDEPNQIPEELLVIQALPRLSLLQISRRRRVILFTSAEPVRLVYRDRDTHFEVLSRQAEASAHHLWRPGATSQPAWFILVTRVGIAVLDAPDIRPASSDSDRLVYREHSPEPPYYSTSKKQRRLRSISYIPSLDDLDGKHGTRRPGTARRPLTRRVPVVFWQTHPSPSVVNSETTPKRVSSDSSPVSTLQLRHLLLCKLHVMKHSLQVSSPYAVLRRTGPMSHGFEIIYAWC
ncbi:hypothetical protein GGR52DRAFT_8611 [Hypoxylon sp. FL1284]|nr:hypothetical protein GGR52DRAFT_8611 [Hypoxylon sp. FL1284]